MSKSTIQAHILPENAQNSVGFDAAITGEFPGGGEPAAYLKEASVSGNVLTLVNKDGSTVAYEPEIPEPPVPEVVKADFEWNGDMHNYQCTSHTIAELLEDFKVGDVIKLETADVTEGEVPFVMVSVISVCVSETGPVEAGASFAVADETSETGFRVFKNLIMPNMGSAPGLLLDSNSGDTTKAALRGAAKVTITKIA